VGGALVETVILLTTLANPAIWLLAATLIAALAGWRRAMSARDTTLAVVGWATRLPVLLALAAMAVGGVGTRAVLGYLSPGAYAEEVLAARSFAGEGRLYPSHARETLDDLIAGSAGGAVPWASVPGITPCEADALENRARFYTEHAHPPTLLLAAVPFVSIAGDKGLYLFLLAVSLASIGTLAWIVIDRMSLAWRSRQAALVVVMIAGWQPVLAGLRQGDAVLVAAALVASAWHLSVRRGTSSALAAAIAACLFPPAIGASLALLRTRRRSGVLAAALIGVFALTTVLVAGSSVAADFIRTIGESASTYADATANYSMAARLARSAPAAVSGLVLLLLLAFSWWIATTRDAAFALLVTAALVAAPMLWSQHLALLFVPLAVLLEAVVRRASPIALAAWAALALALALPDPVVIVASRSFVPVLGSMPIAPLGLVVLWIALLAAAGRARTAGEASARAVAVAS
jgi:hypothetical protein